MEEKNSYAYIAIVAIVAIVAVVVMMSGGSKTTTVTPSFTNEDVVGDALAIKFAQSYKYENPQICKAFCPSGFNAIMNKSCININNSCIGNVSCGRFINGTLMNITSGYCNMESQASLK